MKFGLAVLLAAAVTGCVKMYEDVSNEYVARPGYGVEIPVNPPWDSLPPADTLPVGK